MHTGPVDSRATCLAIQTASSEEQVISAVQTYLSSLSAAQAASMPAGLIALGKSHAENIVQSALQLVHDEMLSVLDTPEPDLLREAVTVLAAASTRLAALAAFKS